MAALLEAILSYPAVVPLLADKIDVALDPPVRSRAEFRIEVDAGCVVSPYFTYPFLTLPNDLRSLDAPAAALHALAHLYVQRSASLWKPPAHASWFSACVTTAPTAQPPTPRRTALLALLTQSPGVLEALYRHATVCELAAVQRFFPPAVRAAAKASLACDPLPPGTAVSVYGEAYFAGTEELFVLRPRGTQAQAEAQARVDERMLARAIPNERVRRRVMELLAEVAAQFPGGLPEMVERLGEDAVDEMVGQVQATALEELEAEARAGAEGMPGGFGEGEGIPIGDAPIAVDGGGGNDETEMPPLLDGGEEESDSEDEYPSVSYFSCGYALGF